jgi:phosphatidylserine/phosphatidylglycerophosphate/cardiolipin synthase-like enzyme
VPGLHARDTRRVYEELLGSAELVFVTSANLTEAALDRNIEVGLLVRDRALALSAVELLWAVNPGRERAP